ncbi:MAG: site-specific integrase [Mesorhizobium sp.]|uniref:site-specific integrase n=1 Tax=Mesorhizobium sp. TaxID=1871066 RepID=UPI001204983F|nr:site-specific integrase [Mesorhizobium sp.]TIM13262.1 MAG: site-specific integrase [Mesorhizobium sp.]
MNMRFTPAPKMDQVLTAVLSDPGISWLKRQEFQSALRSLEKWSGQNLKNIPATAVDLRDLYDRLEPAVLGIRPKTFANVKSLSITAIAKSELVSGIFERRTGRRPKSPEWAELWNRLRLPVQQNSLSRLVNWCNREELVPQDVDSKVIERVLADMAESSLRKDQYQVHRSMAKMWNNIVDLFPEKRLQKVDVPVSRLRRSRVPPTEFPESFRQDWNGYAAWAHGDDVFADNARPKPLKQNTLDSYFQRVHLAASTLVQTGVKATSVRTLADLVTVDAFKRILGKRHEVTNGLPSHENFQLAWLLVRLARDWVNVNEEILAELKYLAKRVPALALKMTRKNKLLVMRFDDPDLQKRFLTAPERMWQDVQKSQRRKHWRLAEAQAALGIEILMFVPVRLKNLTALAFEEHLFLREAGTSTLMLSADETKTGENLEFDIPPNLAARLLEYRNVIAPAVIGHEPKHLFANDDGSVKGFASVRYLVQRYFKRYVGMHMNPHAFRHLAAKFILDSSPGGHVVVQHLLGHKKLETTATFYAGLDTLRAGRHHHALLTKALDESRANRPDASRSRRVRLEDVE